MMKLLTLHRLFDLHRELFSLKLKGKIANEHSKEQRKTKKFLATIRCFVIIKHDETIHCKITKNCKSLQSTGLPKRKRTGMSEDVSSNPRISMVLTEHRFRDG